MIINRKVTKNIINMRQHADESNRTEIKPAKNKTEMNVQKHIIKM